MKSRPGLKSPSVPFIPHSSDFTTIAIRSFFRCTEEMPSIVLIEAKLREKLNILALAKKNNFVYVRQTALSFDEVKRLIDDRPRGVKVRCMSPVIAVTYAEWFGIRISTSERDENINYRSDIILVHNQHTGSWNRIIFKPIDN